MNTLEAARWLAFARSDLDAARALLSDPNHYPRQVCFLAQQSAEKVLKSVLKERSAVQTHFNDLCALLEQTPPAEADPSGTQFTFEAGADKTSGGKGFADVWKRN